MKPSVDPANFIHQKTEPAFEIIPVVEVMSTEAPSIDFSNLIQDPKAWFLLAVVVLVFKLLTYKSKKKGE